MQCCIAIQYFIVLHLLYETVLFRGIFYWMTALLEYIDNISHIIATGIIIMP